MRLAALTLAVSLVAAACAGASTESGTAVPAPSPTASLSPSEVTTADEENLAAALALVDLQGPGINSEVLRSLVDSEDDRWAWVFADITRFFPVASPEALKLGAAVQEITGFDLGSAPTWITATNALIDADVAAPPGYSQVKQALFGFLDERWEPMLNDVSGLDLRYLSWGGVFPDDRSFGDTGACPGRGCIPALDEPAVTGASGGDWYNDDRVVFGIVVGDDSRAYPKNMMEVHEMVNDTLGDRQIAMPYCTLCGSAQAYFADNLDGVDGRLVLRTSGLLSRSNKVMFDLNTESLWDTFTGRAASGPLGEAGIVLEPVTVEVSTWGDWKLAHPSTTILASDGGRGLTYADDPLGGRDDNGPIFPIGSVDERLSIQDQVVTAEAPDGTAVAFPVDSSRSALEAGETVEIGGVVLTTDGSGFRAETSNGENLPAHQAFWFAWIQRHPETELWAPG